MKKKDVSEMTSSESTEIEWGIQAVEEILASQILQVHRTPAQMKEAAFVWALIKL
jgi:hypothetical protein